jgi:RND superfamily putative drug exporter
MPTQEVPQEHTVTEATTPSSRNHLAILEMHSTYRIGLAYGRQVYRFRWFIIALWVVALLVSLPFASKVSSALKGGGYTFSGSDSVHVSDIVIEKLHMPPSIVLVVFHSAKTPVSDPTYQNEMNELTRRAKTLSSVTTIVPGGTGKDGRTAYLVINLNKRSAVMQQNFNDFRTTLTGKSLTGPARVYLTGDLAVYDEFNQISQTETERADATALPLALAVLLLVFASFVAAVTPILLTIVVVPIALAIIYAFALHTETNVIVLTIASIIGLGLSIDYSLFLVRRFRDELASGQPVRDAVALTVATSGEAILFSGLTVMIGFTGLLLIGMPFMTSFGIGGAVVVSIAVLGALTLLPALLGILGPRINALRLPWIGRLAQPVQQVTTSNRVVREERQGFWHTWALIVMRRPVLILVLVSTLLLGLGWPVLQMEIGIPTATSLPSNAEARQGSDLLHTQFPATNDHPIYIIAQTPDGSSILTPNNLARLDHLTRWLQQQHHITSVTSLTHLPDVPGTPTPTTQQLAALYSTGAYQQNPQLVQFVSATTAHDTTLITAQSDTGLDSKKGDALIDTLRAGDKSAAQGLTVLVGGFQAVVLDFDRYLYSHFPLAVLFILIATYILLLLMFRSLLLPLKAILMNVLSISVAYGVLVYVFQWGNFQNLLGFTSEGFIESTLPVTMFCVLFGLSMDYEVFLLSRIYEEWLSTGNNHYAVARGLEKTGSVITNAALLFAIVAGAITFTSLVGTKEIGLGMTVAVLVDATIIRSLLVPATMRLLGRWNWWLPGRPLPPKQTELEIAG